MNLEERVVVKITDLNRDSDGVAKHDGAVIFIPGSLPGDEVLVEITELKRNYFKAKVIEYIKLSEDRITALCPHAEGCSGCSLQELEYNAEIKLKRDLIQNNLEKIAGIKREIEFIASSKTEGYRNKITLKVDDDGNLGYYKRGSRNHYKIKNCIIAGAAIQSIIPSVQRTLIKHNRVFKEKVENRYPIKEVVLRMSSDNGVMLIIGSLKAKFYGADSLFKELSELPEVETVYLREDVFVRRRFKEHRYILKQGKRKMNYQIGDLKYVVSPESFTQINSYMTETLYDTALNFIKRENSEYLIDLFCGIGTTTCYFSGGSKNLYGVEISKTAIKDASENAKLNNIDNIIFQAADANTDTSDLIHTKKPDTIVVDPPRAGIERILIENIITSTAKRVVYISCDPATLSRDVKLFVDGGFMVDEIVGVDLFPRTLHVESIILMTYCG